jgi:hypothetical protein
MMRIVAAAIPLFLLLQVAPGPTATSLNDLPKTPVPATYFGLNNAGRTWTHPWPTMETGAIRLFDSAWLFVEPQRGQWVFENLDRDVEEAQKHHEDLHLMITSSPTWASARPADGARAEPADIKDWEEYVGAVAKRYKGRVHTYELWNEPNLKSNYTGDIPHLIALSKAAYRILKQTDPTVVVVSPALASGNNPFAYLRPFLTGSGPGTFDVLGFHFYDNLGNPVIHPENIVGTTGQLRRILTSVGLGSTPIWNTESGYYIESGPHARFHNRNFPNGVHVLGQKEAVAALGRGYILGWAGGLQRFYWYAWAEPAYALVDDGGGTEKDPTLAYKTVMRWLLGKRYLDVTRSASGMWIVHVEDAQHKPGWIIWDETGTENFTVPKEWGVSKSEDLLSQDRPLSPTGFPVTNSPTLLF